MANTPSLGADVTFTEGSAPSRPGRVALLHPGSSQVGIEYTNGVQKVWVCIEDVSVDFVDGVGYTTPTV